MRAGSEMPPGWDRFGDALMMAQQRKTYAGRGSMISVGVVGGLALGVDRVSCRRLPLVGSQMGNRRADRWTCKRKQVRVSRR